MAKTIIEELVGIVGLEVDQAQFKKGAKALDNVKKQYDRVASAATKLGIAAAAVGGFVVITNKLTAEQERMAEAVGISSKTLEAYGGIAKQAGLETDVVVDLVEELNNKLGESKGLEELTAVTEATAILGLEFENLKKLKPEEQFFRVLEAAQQLGDAQAASSAADILLGGEANKFIGLLRSQDKGLQELIDTYGKYNLLTDESREQAKAFNKTFGVFGNIVGSATKELAALLSRGLEPVIKSINNWVANNKELSQTIVKVFSIVIPAALAVATIAVGLMTVKLIGMGLAVLGVTWPILALIAAFVVAGTVIGLIVDDVYRFIKSGNDADTVIGSLINKFMEFTGIGNVFSFIGEGIDYAITGMKELASLLGAFSFGSVATGLGDLFSGIDLPNFNLPDLGGALSFNAPSLALAGGAGGGSVTTNNVTKNATSNVTLNAPNLDRKEYINILDEQMAIATRTNDTGFDR